MHDKQPKLVILDRDGVINQDSRAYIKSPDEWIALPGSVEAIAALSRAGFRVVIATNQSGLGRSLFSAATLDDIHAKLEAAVQACGGQIDGIFVCPHLPDAGCDCRKPKPGLLEQIAQAFDCTVASVPVIGDSLRDLEAAMAAGGQPVLVRTGNGRSTEERLDKAWNVRVYDDLASAADAIIFGER